MNPKLSEEIQKRRRADERARRIKRAIVFLLGYAVVLFFAFYGLKCILTLQGKIINAARHPHYHYPHLFYLVTGKSAVMAGLGYLCSAIFCWSFVGTPPDEEQSGWWSVGCGIIRWGGFVGMFVFWLEAYLLRAGGTGFL